MQNNGEASPVAKARRPLASQRENQAHDVGVVALANLVARIFRAESRECHFARGGVIIAVRGVAASWELSLAGKSGGGVRKACAKSHRMTFPWHSMSRSSCRVCLKVAVTRHPARKCPEALSIWQRETD